MWQPADILQRKPSSTTSLAGSKPKDRMNGRLEDKPAALQPPWAALAKAHAAQYVSLVVLLFVLWASEHWEPFRHVLYPSEIGYYTYSYPLRPNHVPAWAVPCVAVFGPILVVVGFLLAGRINRVEAHHACLMVFYCVATTGLLTNWIKTHVGRPRPNFVHRCWPNGLKPVFTPEGLPKCADNAIDPSEGIKSFPSGHTSWSTSGLGFLTFWLLGKLRCFDGAAQPGRFLLALTPLLCALWIGMSRIQDYWHHVEDVAAGFCLGLLMAHCFYRQVYMPVMGQHAGMLTAAVYPPGGSSKGSLSAAPSRYGLLNGSSGGDQPLDEQQPLYGDDKV